MNSITSQPSLTMLGLPAAAQPDQVPLDLLTPREFRQHVETWRLGKAFFWVLEFQFSSRVEARHLIADLQGEADHQALVGWLGPKRVGLLTQQANSVESILGRRRQGGPACRVKQIFAHGMEGSCLRTWVGRRRFRSLNEGNREGSTCFADAASPPPRPARQRGVPRSWASPTANPDDSPSSAPRFHRTSRPVHELYTVPTPVWKRSCDFFVASLALLLASPLLVLAALLIKGTSRGSLFFVQERVGHGGRPFRMYKLRTMRHDAHRSRGELLDQNEMNGSAFKLRTDPRVTPVGRVLRRWSVDEIPQLWNIIRGDMSLVGPRPLPCEDWHPESIKESRRHDVVPGLTCLWQVMGRNEIGWHDWVRLDCYYVRRRSWWLDVRILLATVPAVLSRRGAQ